MFEWFTWEWVVGLGLVGVLGVGAVTWYFTGSLKLAGAAMATVGTAVLYAAVKRKGREEGYNAAMQKVEKENAEVRKESKKIEQREAKRTPAQRRKRGSRFVHDG